MPLPAVESYLIDSRDAFPVPCSGRTRAPLGVLAAGSAWSRLSYLRRGPYGLRYVLTACVLRHPVAYLSTLVLSNSAHCVLRIAYCALETQKPAVNTLKTGCLSAVAYCVLRIVRRCTDEH